MTMNLTTMQMTSYLVARKSIMTRKTTKIRRKKMKMEFSLATKMMKMRRRRPPMKVSKMKCGKRMTTSLGRRICTSMLNSLTWAQRSLLCTRVKSFKMRKRRAQKKTMSLVKRMSMETLSDATAVNVQLRQADIVAAGDIQPLSKGVRNQELVLQCSMMTMMTLSRKSCRIQKLMIDMPRHPALAVTNSSSAGVSSALSEGVEGPKLKSSGSNSDLLSSNLGLGGKGIEGRGTGLCMRMKNPCKKTNSSMI